MSVQKPSIMTVSVLEWLQGIKDEDVRAKALANYDGLHCTAYDLKHALGIAFFWRNTREGRDYWAEQYRRAFNNEL